MAGAAVAAGRVEARQQAQKILADAQAALRHILGERADDSPSPAPEGVQAMTFPTPLPPHPKPVHPSGKTPMEIAQELAEAALAASEEGIRAAMAVSQQAIEAANEAARRADQAAEEAVRRAAEANAR
jgi:ABC-type branched-subunit amino acid transport system substrate-binding protein